jgi:septum formation protein
MSLSLVLASQSPRRIELITQLVSDYEVAPSAVEEAGSELWPDWELPSLALPSDFQVPPEMHPTLWAWRKAVDIAMNLPDNENEPIVLGADTVVVARGMLLGKPNDYADAMRMLQGLRGRRHFVVTGHALVQRNGPEVTMLHAGATASAVWMREYSGTELEGYVATGEPLDKAGAYALQGLGGGLVERIEGCYKNVVGLPLCDARRALAAADVDLLAYPEGGFCASCPSREANL